jgi:hypothetical protein
MHLGKPLGAAWRVRREKATRVLKAREMNEVGDAAFIGASLPQNFLLAGTIERNYDNEM